MLMKPCPRCKRMIPYGLSYCSECAPIAAAEWEAKREHNAAIIRQKYNNRRDPKYLSFYRSKAWKMTSRAKLQDAGYQCEAKLAGCQGLAVEVHHKKPIQTAEGWEERLDWNNLEAVCTACHNRRHPEKWKRKNESNVIDLAQLK